MVGKSEDFEDSSDPSPIIEHPAHQIKSQTARLGGVTYFEASLRHHSIPFAVSKTNKPEIKLY